MIRGPLLVYAVTLFVVVFADVDACDPIEVSEGRHQQGAGEVLARRRSESRGGCAVT